MLFKILNGTLYICDKWGNPGKRIAENVNFATFDQDSNQFLVTANDGKLHLKDVMGNPVRTLANDIYEARFSGIEIIARRKDGKNVILDKMGNVKRFI